jgi:hypothetical protein
MSSFSIESITIWESDKPGLWLSIALYVCPVRLQGTKLHLWTWPPGALQGPVVHTWIPWFMSSLKTLVKVIEGGNKGTLYYLIPQVNFRECHWFIHVTCSWRISICLPLTKVGHFVICLPLTSRKGGTFRDMSPGWKVVMAAIFFSWLISFSRCKFHIDPPICKTPKPISLIFVRERRTASFARHISVRPDHMPYFIIIDFRYEIINVALNVGRHIECPPLGWYVSRGAGHSICLPPFWATFIYYPISWIQCVVPTNNNDVRPT